jgi:hypothetical protein
LIYDPAKFQTGSTVRISGRAVLDEFFRSWKLHNPLQPNQMECAEMTSKVARSFMYHGGDILYELEGLPGVWHEQLLEAVQPENSN